MLEIHAGFMLAGLFSIVAGVTVAMSARKKKWWLSIHKKLGYAGSSSVIFGFIAALYMVSRYTGEHFAVPHTYLGLVTILSVSFTFTMGIMQFKVRRKVVNIRLIHRWSGRVTLSLMLLNVLSGFFLAGLL
ncbi:MAG: hypothetical protein JRC66_09530 [Deltaproteobacteria bacterium]|nr:hypothetical protein [Deltaproteobacteria bacterium]